MIEAPETFWTLLHDAAHWEFEIFLMVVFDGIIGYLGFKLFWSFIKKHWNHHLERDEREAGKPTVAHTVLGAYGVREDDVLSWTLTNETLTVVFRSK